MTKTSIMALTQDVETAIVLLKEMKERDLIEHYTVNG